MYFTRIKKNSLQQSHHKQSEEPSHRLERDNHNQQRTVFRVQEMLLQNTKEKWTKEINGELTVLIVL